MISNDEIYMQYKDEMEADYDWAVIRQWEGELHEAGEDLANGISENIPEFIYFN